MVIDDRDLLKGMVGFFGFAIHLEMYFFSQSYNRTNWLGFVNRDEMSSNLDDRDVMGRRVLSSRFR
jgi:hypothetical protein